MTNKEAIEALKRIRDEAINNFVGDWQDYEAFGIALKALAGCKTADAPQTEDPPLDEYYKDHDAFYEPQTDCAWMKGE